MIKVHGIFVDYDGLNVHKDCGKGSKPYDLTKEGSTSHGNIFSLVFLHDQFFLTLYRIQKSITIFEIEY